MRVLLDTHILLWALADDERLPEKARRVIEDGENEVYFSVISLWEIELKHLAHSEAFPITAKDVSEYCEQAGYSLLRLRKEHIYGLSSLSRSEDIPRHKDPFDRVLICQASGEDMMFVTHDGLIAQYDDPHILVV